MQYEAVYLKSNIQESINYVVGNIKNVYSNTELKRRKVDKNVNVFAIFEKLFTSFVFRECF